MSRIRLSRKTLVISIASLLVLAIVAVAILFWSQISGLLGVQKNATDLTQDTSQMSDSDKQAVSMVYQKALEAVGNSTDTSAGTKVIDEAIDKSGDDKAKAQLYLYKATIIGNSGSDDSNTKSEALKAAYESDRLNPTYQSAMTIAQLEDALGNKEAADKYYDLFDQRTKGDEMGGS